MTQVRISRVRARVFLLSVIAGALLPAVASLTAWTAPSPSTRPAQNRPAVPAGPPPNTSYLAGMPSVESVERVIQGSDPTDTLARQVAVFNILPELIERMGMDPSRRYGDTTTDEYKQRSMYQQAAIELTQGYAKSHTADELKAFNQLHSRYELLDGSLRQEMFQKLFTQEFLNDYKKVDAAASAHQQAHYDQEKNAAAQAQKPRQVLSDRDEFFAYLRDPHTIRFFEIMAIPYFLPTIYGLIKGYWRGLRFVFFFNLFFAWTVVGWFYSWVLVRAIGRGMNAPPAPPVSPPVSPPSMPPALPYCPRCGAAWAPGARLCGSCGAAAS